MEVTLNNWLNWAVEWLVVCSGHQQCDYRGVVEEREGGGQRGAEGGGGLSRIEACRLNWGLNPHSLSVPWVKWTPSPYPPLHLSISDWQVNFCQLAPAYKQTSLDMPSGCPRTIVVMYAKHAPELFSKTMLRCLGSVQFERTYWKAHIGRHVLEGTYWKARTHLLHLSKWAELSSWKRGHETSPLWPYTPPPDLANRWAQDWFNRT